MKRLSAIVAVCIGMASCAAWCAQAPQRAPSIGYVYPAGASRGSTVRVVVAGQRLRSVVWPLIGGVAVQSQLVQYVPAGGPLTKLQEDELRRQIAEIRDSRRSGQRRNTGVSKSKPCRAASGSTASVVLPPFPELEGLEMKSNAELAAVSRRFLDRSRRPKPPIAEVVTFDLSIPVDAAPGVYSLRVMGRDGVSNPVRFVISDMAECSEPLDAYETPMSTALSVPCVANGRIMPGQADRWVVTLPAGEAVRLSVSARALIPYLADAVPGWFQPVITVYDRTGRIAAYADDTMLGPDPDFMFRPERSDTYTIEVRDALWRGREDFVYRLTVQRHSVSRPEGKSAAWPTLGRVSEKEPNDTGVQSQAVTIPCVVSGVIATPGDRDVWRLTGHKGQPLVVDVRARRDRSPADPLVRLIDANGRVVAWNDDTNRPEEGLLTHQADPYLRTKLPADGTYYVQISDAQGHGGTEYRYQMRLSAPMPGFSVLVSPSAVNVPTGGTALMKAHVFRHDGWTGPVRLSLAEPAGYSLNGAFVPDGVDVLPFTVTAGNSPGVVPQALRIVAAADNDPTIRCDVHAVDERMQAFAYTHLVPAEDAVIMTLGTRKSGYHWLGRASEERLEISANTPVTLSVQIPKDLLTRNAAVEPLDLPEGIVIQQRHGERGVIDILVSAAKSVEKRSGNLICVVTADPPAKGSVPSQGRRQSLGILPAVPFTVIP